MVQVFMSEAEIAIGAVIGEGHDAPVVVDLIADRDRFTEQDARRQRRGAIAVVLVEVLVMDEPAKRKFGKKSVINRQAPNEPGISVRRFSLQADRSADQGRR